MRVYKDFTEAKNEITRDLNELGTEVFAGYQSKEVNEEDFTTKELQNYDYCVLQPRKEDLDRVTIEWAEAEWQERLSGIEQVNLINPGTAYKLREDLWSDLIEDNGRFAYSYNERFFNADVPSMIQAFRKNPNSRQMFISIWSPADGEQMGSHRVPCTIGYHLMIRNGHLDITYYMRSSDFDTHFDNDCWMALSLQEYVANEMGVPTGKFTHILNSLHVYATKVAGTF